MIHLQWYGLLALLPLPWLVWRFMPPAHQDRPRLRLATYAEIADPQGLPQQGQRWLKWLAYLAWVLLVLACSRPQWLGEPIGQPRQGRDLMLAVDLSGSMQMEDMVYNGQTVDRLTMVKYVLNDFIKRRAGDRLGLVLFADQAYLQAPLTFDHDTVRKLLADTVLGLVGTQTAIGDAIGLSVKHMIQQHAHNKVLILLTDGQNNVGAISPLQAADLAAEQGVTIYTIGVGADEMLQRSLFNTRRFNPSADLDEKTLKQIAEKTHGKYFRARDGKTLEQIYQLIDKLEPVASDKTYVRPRTDLFYWPLLAALLLSLVLVFPRLTNRRMS